MVDEVQTAAPVSAPAEPSVAVAAPVADASPVIESSPAPAATESSPAAADSLLGAEPATEAKADAEPAATPEAKPEVKPEEKTAEGESKPEDKKPDETAKDDKPAEPSVPATYEPFKLPDAYKDNPDAAETVNKFSSILGNLEVSKREHADFQKFGQEATDFYINGVQGALNKQQEYFAGIHEKNIADRIDAVRNDPQLGGKNFEKTTADMIEAVQAYGGSKEQIVALRKDMQESGMGVAPSLVRMVANMKAELDKYTKEPVSSNLTGTKPDVQKRGTIATLYGT